MKLEKWAPKRIAEDLDGRLISPNMSMETMNNNSGQKIAPDL